MESADETTQQSAMSEGDNGESPHRTRQPSTCRGRRARATVYDAVAGRVTNDKVLRGEGREQKKLQAGTNQRAGRDNVHLPPEDVLFRHKDAPERYEEYDIYRASERELPHGGRGLLPESDLLKAIHEYASEFYAVLNRGHPRQSESGRNVDERSMDETALLAFGILLEEAGREVLGRRGHLVFTEGSRNDGDDGRGDEPLAQDPPNDGGAGHHHEEAGSWRSGPKRRKVDMS